MLSIVHILPNDKFSPINIFDGTDSNNTYYCIVDEGVEIAYLDKNRVHAITYKQLLNVCLTMNSHIVILHSLPTSFYGLVLALPAKVKVVWALWGYDMYYGSELYRPIYEMSLYKPLTQKWYNSLYTRPLFRQFTHSFKRIIQYSQFKAKEEAKKQAQIQATEIQNRVLDRIDYCAPIFVNEMDLLAQNPHFRAHYFPFQYSRWHVDDDFGSVDYLEKATFIQLGNSADTAGNMLDVLALLRKREITNTVYLPMAYGDEEYKNAVSDFIDKHKMNAIVQDKMIPYDEYYHILQNCRVAIYGHLRQQASDSIHMSLLRGNKVFMYSESVGYQYYKQTGFYIYNIENDLTAENIADLLDEEQIAHNRKLVLDTVSIEGVTKRVDKFLKDIENA